MFPRQKYNRANFDALQSKLRSIEAYAKDLAAADGEPATEIDSYLMSQSIRIGNRLLHLIKS